MAQWKQYSGMWTRQQQMQAVSASTWTGLYLGDGLFTVGYNTNGQLGQNDIVSRSSPVQVGTTIGWSTVFSSRAINFTALKTNGTLWSCGPNYYGSLGLGDDLPRSSPVQIGALTNWSSNTSPGDAAFAIKTDGTLWSWGQNSSGQLGQSDKIFRSSPVQIGSLTTWAYSGSGYDNLLAIKTDGTLWGCGNNVYGTLGQNNRTYRSSPVQIGSGSTWSSASTSDLAMLAIKTDGTLWTWGRNDFGQLGQNDTINRSSPVQVGSLTNWSKAVMRVWVMALKTDGTLWAWGRNIYGNLGQPDLNYRSSPVQVGSESTWLTITCGTYSTIASKSDSNLLYGLGANNRGQLGLGNTANVSTMTQLPASSNWSSVGMYGTSTGFVIKTYTS